jgi:RimJ/RimL family protein N-acetyltransferase
LSATPFFDEAKVALRPIEAGDLETLRRWRNLDRVRLRMFDRVAISAEQQRAWWQRRERDADYRQYLLSYDGEGIGSISFTTGSDAARATCGYYVGAEPAPPRAGTLLMYAGLRRAYGSGISEVTCEIRRENEPSIRLVQRFGFEETDGRADVRVFVLDAAAFAAREAVVRNLLFAREEVHAAR